MLKKIMEKKKRDYALNFQDSSFMEIQVTKENSYIRR